MSTRVASESVVWVVDYDIPVTKDRFRFYRGLSRLKKELGLFGEMSSMSVLITRDHELAYRVYQLASAYTDRVHLYEAKEVTSQRGAHV